MNLWQQGDEAAFESIYRRYLMPMLSIAYNKTGDREIAKELVQESFIDLYTHKTSISSDTSIKSYLYVILKNKILGIYRKEKVRQKYFANIAGKEITHVDTTAQHIETRELEQLLKNEIENLPEKCRMVFKLSREEFLSDKEIAERMDISLNTVEQHKRKALRMLRTSLGNYAEIAILLFLLKK
ncbi:RNA polymerase sigma factor [Pinibacter aurantiacus]|uniref:RNA polymerase sigma factor n=1 Tax=Pinibacter aurantiacus TaxID=2851599 RepID=UPI00293D4547|nr:RNA polymerase sigma-70 factor [Pinibacter aurantiacus]